MATYLNLGVRPRVIIGAVAFDDGPLWDWLYAGSAGGIYAYPTNILAETAVPDSIVRAGSAGTLAWLAAHPPSKGVKVYLGEDGGLPDWPKVFLMRPMLWKNFTGYGNSEDYFYPLVRAGKSLGVSFTPSNPADLQQFGGISSGFSIASDFLPGAAAVVLIAVGAHYGGELVSDYLAQGAVEATPFVGPAEAVATLAPAVETVAPTLASVVDAAPAFVGPVEAVGSGWTFSEVVAAAKTTAGVVKTAAGIVGTVTAAVSAITNPGAVAAPTPPVSDKPADKPTDNSALLIVGAVSLLLFMG